MSPLRSSLLLRLVFAVAVPVFAVDPTPVYQDAAAAPEARRRPPGASDHRRKSVVMEIDPADLAAWNPAEKRWQATAGEYTLRAGDSSRELPLQVVLKR